MWTRLNAIRDELNEITSELEELPITGDALVNLVNYGMALDELDNANSDLQEVGAKVIDRLEELSYSAENGGN